MRRRWQRWLKLTGWISRLQERALRVLLGLQPLTTTAYPLRVLPANIYFAGIARSYKSQLLLSA
jgi:hypothetical protein